LDQTDKEHPNAIDRSMRPHFVVDGFDGNIKVSKEIIKKYISCHLYSGGEIE
jgi:hypothetical protein